MRFNPYIILGLLGMGGFGYALYKIVELIFRGFVERDIWLLAGGGILLIYFGGGLLLAGFALCAYIAYLILWDK